MEQTGPARALKGSGESNRRSVTPALMAIWLPRVAFLASVALHQLAAHKLLQKQSSDGAIAPG